MQKYQYYILGFDLPEDVALLARTNTPAAPWTVVESSDKWYARLKTLQTVISYGEQIL